MYVIDDLGYEAVLGRDFLEENGAVIDFRDRTLQLTDSTPLECLTNYPSSPSSNYLR